MPQDSRPAATPVPDAPRTTLDFLAMEWRFLLFGLLVAFWSSPGQTFMISLFGGKIRAEFGLTHGEFGGIYTLATLASAALLLPVGRLIDRLPLAVFTRWVVLGMVWAAGIFSLISGPISLFLGIFALRFTGQGLLSHVSVTSVARRYRRERGRAMAIASLGHPIGEAALPPLVVWSFAFVEWRWIWVCLSLTVAATLLPLLGPLLRRTEHQDGAGPAALAARGEGNRDWTRGELLRDTRFYLVMPLAMAQAAIVTGVLFHQVHFVEVKGWSLAWWGSCFAFYAVASVLAHLVGGLCIDRFSAKALTPLVLLPLAGSLAIFGAAEGALAAPAILFLMGATGGVTGMVTSALWAELYGVTHLGAIRALAGAVSVFASALGPVAMGYFLDLGASLPGILFASLAIVLATSALAVLGLRRAGKPPTFTRRSPG
jgi:MFS family permease